MEVGGRASQTHACSWCSYSVDRAGTRAAAALLDTDSETDELAGTRPRPWVGQGQGTSDSDNELLPSAAAARRSSARRPAAAVTVSAATAATASTSASQLLPSEEAEADGATLTDEDSVTSAQLDAAAAVTPAVAPGEQGLLPRTSSAPLPSMEPSVSGAAVANPAASALLPAAAAAGGGITSTALGGLVPATDVSHSEQAAPGTGAHSGLLPSVGSSQSGLLPAAAALRTPVSLSLSETSGSIQAGLEVTLAMLNRRCARPCVALPPAPPRSSCSLPAACGPAGWRAWRQRSTVCRSRCQGDRRGLLCCQVRGQALGAALLLRWYCFAPSRAARRRACRGG